MFFILSDDINKFIKYVYVSFYKIYYLKKIFKKISL